VTTVHLVRHGEVYNPDHILYGRLPGYPLSLRGLAQADVVAKHLAARPIGLIVSSPLERARQTAAPLAEALGLDVSIDERLIEAANALEGTRVEGPLSLVKDVRAWRYFGNPTRPSWGEPYAEIVERMLAAVLAAVETVEALPPRLDGLAAEAVCVSHQLPVYSLRRYLEGQRLFHDPRRRECGLASVTTVKFVGTEAVEVDYSEPAAAIVRDAVAGA
jgi:broad specificity phosphatase PhoE